MDQFDNGYPINEAGIKPNFVPPTAPQEPPSYACAANIYPNCGKIETYIHEHVIFVF